MGFAVSCGLSCPTARGKFRGSGRGSGDRSIRGLGVGPGGGGTPPLEGGRSVGGLGIEHMYVYIYIYRYIVDILHINI